MTVVSVLLPAACRLCDGWLVRASRLPIGETCLAAFIPLEEGSVRFAVKFFEASFPTSGRAETEDGARQEQSPTLCPSCQKRGSTPSMGREATPAMKRS
jgi:hypothetical protein